MILIAEQVYIFLYAILAGCIVTFLYDIIRIKRRAIKTNTIIISLEDILFWLIAAILVFLTVYSSNDGQMRGFILIGNILGVVFYLSLLSRFVIASSMIVINFLKKLILFVWMVISYPFKLIFRILSVPVRFFGRCLGKPGRAILRITGKAVSGAGRATGRRFKKVTIWGRGLIKIRKKG